MRRRTRFHFSLPLIAELPMIDSPQSLSSHDTGIVIHPLGTFRPSHPDALRTFSKAESCGGRGLMRHGKERFWKHELEYFLSSKTMTDGLHLH